ncbi:MAG: PQQ-dependent sugar dehydrogenase, partial [Thermoleophilia bacterium]|nr:PQQ-dependent sugar dehydrogenase [Thermoleophilia bacterium]
FAGPTPGEDEIWSYGLRNPWRFSFDRLTGDLVIGDVGYSTWEEVDFAAGPDPGKGDNFGWNCREGMNQFSTAPPCDAAQAFTEPVFEYEHLDGNCSITGGYVVRDPALGDLYGRYLYADWCVGELRSLALEPPVLGRSEGLCVQFPTSFGEDSSGRIYVTSYYGPVYRLTAGGSSGACATDTTPPDTTIDSGPSGTINTDQATFTFSGSPAGDTAKIQCKIDSDPFADCTSPKTFNGLADGPHTATFRAEDGAGNQDQTPATRTFTVDTTAPTVTIAAPAQGSTVTTTSISASFTADEAGSSFECRLDTGAFAACSSPKAYPGLAEGSHTIEVRATDQVGNTGAPASRAFTVKLPDKPPVADDCTAAGADLSAAERKLAKAKKQKKKATKRFKKANRTFGKAIRKAEKAGKVVSLKKAKKWTKAKKKFKQAKLRVKKARKALNAARAAAEVCG